MKSPVTPVTTPEDMTDLVEYSVNETKPRLKTSRGTGNEFSICVGGRKFVVSVSKQTRKTKTSIRSG